jgi:GNAT superfamily N-acetyltransferase
MIPDRPLRLIRPDLAALPTPDLPAGLELRPFADGDDEVWLALQEAAEPRPPFEQDSVDAFGRLGARRRRACLFLVADTGVEMGTITATQGRRSPMPVPADGTTSEDLEEEAFRAAVRHQRDEGVWGMPAWLAVHPDHRGRRLALPLVAACLAQLAADHDRALVRTTSARPAAIKRWLQFGFRPDTDEPGAEATWAALWEAYPTLRTVTPVPPGR